MAKEILSVDREDLKKTIEQFKFQWLKHVLIQTGMQLDDCFPEGDDPDSVTLDHKAKLRSILNKNDVLINYEGEEIKVYIDKSLIAEWRQPKYALHKDLSQIDPKKKLYVKAVIDYWSVFDGYEIQENEEFVEEE